MSDYKEFDGIDSALTQLPREDLEKIRKIIYGKETQISDEQLDFAIDAIIDMEASVPSGSSKAAAAAAKRKIEDDDDDDFQNPPASHEAPLPSSTIDVSDECKELAFKYNIELVTCGFNCKEEQLRSPKLIRVAAFQHKLVPFPTSTPIQEMKYALFKFANKAIRIAARGGANIFCFPELWNMPYAFCTREKTPWCEYAESAKTGPTTKMLQELAKIHNMVIISPILERDDIYNDTLWNTAVIIDNHGEYLGKYRKNHISRNAYLNESIYYTEGNAGHPVFETEFGNIAVCLGSYYPLSWLMFGLNGADIVFNPSAVAGEASEPLWGVAARNAAIANSYFTCAVNRAGTEVFVNDFTTGDGKPPHRESDYFFGSSYITAPNGTRSPGLSRTSNGLLIAEMDLNLCRQIKDQWGLQMTQRLEMYAKLLSKAAQVNFVPQRIRKSQD